MAAGGDLRILTLLHPLTHRHLLQPQVVAVQEIRLVIQVLGGSHIVIQRGD
jgi:hypothetical protein